MDEEYLWGDLMKFKDAIAKFKESLEDDLKEDIKEELFNLREEVVELRELKENYEDKVKELEWTKKLIEEERLTMKQSVRRERLSELLDPFLKELWCIDAKLELGPKCDKCDSERYIHFVSPQGHGYKERCKCSNTIPNYFVKKSEFKSLYSPENYSSPFHDTVMVKLEKCGDSSEEYIRADRLKTLLYSGESFQELKEKYSPHKVFFEDRDKAQEYADWLNENKEEVKRNVSCLA